MEVIVRPTTESAVRLTARLIGDLVGRKPDCVLGLATGRTMEAVYSELAALKKDFSKVTSFNLDEYIGLGPDNKNSYRYYMQSNLFDRINIKKENTNLPNGLANDVKAEGPRYEKAIRDAGGIDLQLLGIGRDGHIGFNEPLSSFASRTRDKALTPETYEQNSPLFDDPAEMPMRAFTMGVGTILDSRCAILLATGDEKADIIAKAVEGPMSSMVTASALQLHPHAIVIVDEAAGAKLQNRKYYDWVFANDPDWKDYQGI